MGEDNLLEKAWHHQKLYNQRIRKESDEKEDINWMTAYLLGMVSEVDEVLDEINWKRHRAANHNIVKDNVARELADVTKYVFSMWEYMGFSSTEMLAYVEEKSEMLAQQYAQEFGELPYGRNILIFDLDGTVADWRDTFSYWLNRANPKIRHTPLDISPHSLQYDSDNGMSYHEYVAEKEEFESTGMYGHIIPYPVAIDAIRDARKCYEAYLICTTARPVKKYKRIWLDTWNWLKAQDIKPDMLLFESESRILLANGLKDNNNVILWEDDPELIIRAANCGIKVVTRRQKYNEYLSNNINVKMVDEYYDDTIIYEGWKPKDDCVSAAPSV